MKAQYRFESLGPPVGRARFVFSGATSTDRATDVANAARLSAMATELGALRDRVNALEAQLEPRVVVIRDISRDQAKQELLHYFKEHPQSYPSDAALELRLDAALVREVCSELIQAGILEG